MPSCRLRDEIVTIWRHTCALCQHEWTTSLMRPTHCPNMQCRTRRWFNGERRTRIQVKEQ